MIPATEGVLRLQMKSKSSMPCTARGCIPLFDSGQTSREAPTRGEEDLLDEASCLVVEEGMSKGRVDTAGGVETTDVVVGGVHAAIDGLGAIDGSRQGGRRHDGGGVL